MTKTEPVLLLAAIATIIVSIAAAFNVVLDTNAVETFLVDGLLVVTAVIQRSKVTPAKTTR